MHTTLPYPSTIVYPLAVRVRRPERFWEERKHDGLGLAGLGYRTIIWDQKEIEKAMADLVDALGEKMEVKSMEGYISRVQVAITVSSDRRQNPDTPFFFQHYPVYADRHPSQQTSP